MTRFGVLIVPSASGRSDPVAEAVRAEELGFDVVAIWDHPHGSTPSYETWTLLTWIAARTSRIGLVTDVLALPFRLPAMVAKMAESLDRLSGGRLVLGLGGGGFVAEAAGYGGAVRSAAEKVEALEEAVALIHGAWSEPELTFRGRHFKTAGMLLEPKPSRPIPIWLGTYGPRALDLTGRMADGWIVSMGDQYLGDPAPKMAAVRSAAERAGRDPDALDYAYNVRVQLGGPRADSKERLAGEPEEVVERLLELTEIGFTVLNLWLGGRREEQLEQFGSQVLPPLRQLVG